MRLLIFELLFCLLFSTLLSAQVQNYEVQKELSSLKFEVSAQVHTVHGDSNHFSGVVSGDPANITTAKVSIQLNPATFDTGNQKRDRTMREKCLEVDLYAQIEFESTEIRADQKELRVNEPLPVVIRGILRLHGIETELDLPVTLLWDQETVYAEGELTISLDDYKIQRPRVMLFRLQSEVKISFRVGARKVIEEARRSSIFTLPHVQAVPTG